MMKKFTVDEQLANLKTAARWPIAQKLNHWMIGTGVVLIIVSALIWNPIPLMIGAFLCIVGTAERRAIPNILNALHACESVQPSSGTAAISISCWSDSNHYEVILREVGQRAWQYEFIPQGWTPTEGTHSARIWRLGRCQAPALAAVEQGILVPRYDPKSV